MTRMQADGRRYVHGAVSATATAIIPLEEAGPSAGRTLLEYETVSLSAQGVEVVEP
jgi:hypothetical protein